MFFSIRVTHANGIARYTRQGNAMRETVADPTTRLRALPCTRCKKDDTSRYKKNIHKKIARDTVYPQKDVSLVSVVTRILATLVIIPSVLPRAYSSLAHVIIGEPLMVLSESYFLQ